MIRTGGWLLLHHANLHRAGLAAQASSGPAVATCSRRRPDRNSPADRGPGATREYSAPRSCATRLRSPGPSATVKPSRPMMSFSSSIVCVIGCRWPSTGRLPGTVGSNGSRRLRRSSPIERASAPRRTRLELGFDLVEALAGRRLVGRRHWPRPFCAAFSRPLFAPRNSTRAASTESAPSAVRTLPARRSPAHRARRRSRPGPSVLALLRPSP